MPELTNTENTEVQGQETTETEKTYSQAEVDELLQKESDRRVSAALKKQEAKNAEKLKEAQKLASMNETQKYEYELQQREAAIAEKERQLTLAENKSIAGKILSEKGLSLDLVDFVVDETAEEMNAKIKTLETAFNKSVRAEVEKRLGGNSPKMSVSKEEALTKESFRKMSIKEQQELYQSNKELYDALTH